LIYGLIPPLAVSIFGFKLPKKHERRLQYYLAASVPILAVCILVALKLGKYNP